MIRIAWELFPDESQGIHRLPESAMKTGGTTMEQKYHVLVVEDDKEIREGIEIYLRNQGYEVYELSLIHI